MGAYRCEYCEGYFCSHDVSCFECPTVKFGLVCDDCWINRDAKDLDDDEDDKD